VKPGRPPIEVVVIERVDAYRGGMLRSIADNPSLRVSCDLDAVPPAPGHSVVILYAVHEMSDLTEIALLRERRPRAPVLVIADVDPALVACAARTGAAGIVAQGAQPEEIFSAIERVAAGERYIHPAALVAGVRSIEARRHSVGKPSGWLSELSQRERTVLALMSDGLTARAAAARLGVGRRTVEAYWSSIYRKLGVRGRFDAVREWQASRQSHGAQSPGDSE